MARGTRPRSERIEVWLKPEEKARIEANAKQCQNSSVSDYLRSLGQGYEPKSRFDAKVIKELMALKADQGRIGGLLKLWLSQPNTEHISRSDIEDMLKEIQENQRELSRWILKEAKKL